MTNDSSWQLRTWARVHPTHGTFFVDVDPDGTAGAVRVHGSPDSYKIEHIAPGPRLDNVALAMMACENRITELDLELEEKACEGLCYSAARVA